MKSIIKKLIRETLNEIAPEPKEMFGLGSYHAVYQSKKNPNRLYKIGTESVVKKWVDIFKRYPQYFPKIYRVFQSSKNPDLYVVEIEKLSTKQASYDLSLIDEFLIEHYKDLTCDKHITIHNFFNSKCMYQIEEILEESDDIYDMHLLPIMKKWAKFLSEVYPMIEAELNVGKNARNSVMLDLHVGNVAYDNSGNIKLIDI